MIAVDGLAPELGQLPVIGCKTRIPGDAALKVLLGALLVAQAHAAGSDQEMQRRTGQSLGMCALKQLQRIGRVAVVAE